MSICAILCGADDWNSIALFAQTREGWFRQHLTLPGGIPSHDTFNRMFSLLDPKAFRTLFITWVQDVMVGSGLSGTVAIDGKTVKGSAWNKGKDAIHMVNAWSTDLGMAVGQYKVDGKSNEITAIPKLLALLELQGCLVTLDAMGCQKRIADSILKRGADYLLAVKANQKSLHKEVVEYFDRYWENTPEDAPGPVFSERAEHQHGRQEHRRCWVLNESSELATAKRWQAKTVAAVQLDRQDARKGDTLIRYYISSRTLTAQEVLAATREHWQVENCLHWVLDVAFDEDRSRARQGFAAENLATARQIVLNLLKQDTTHKVGVKNKRKACGWDLDYMLKVLGEIKI
jgi:predicted transposase YbfD/YdcC